MSLGITDVPVAVFVGATTGALLALLTQLITATIRNYRSYRFLLELLRDEITDIADKVTERQRHPVVVVPLYPPLPTKAWDALVQAQQRRWMPERRRKPLNNLYREVVSANSYLAFVPTVIQISQLAGKQQTRDTYRQEAIELLKRPLPNVRDALGPAFHALGMPRHAFGPTPSVAAESV